MPQPTLLRLARRLHGQPSPPPDRLLLARFARDRDQSAFAALVARHGPLVLGVCRRLLGEAAADDAFQATFLLLARKARAAGRGGSVAPWLYGVALRVARNARRSAERRRRREAHAARPDRSPEAAGPAAALTWRDIRRALDEELGRLPGPQRSALVLCYLEGLTRDEAALRLGWSLGTLKRRLDEGRRALRARLERCGVGPLGLALAPAGLTAVVPADLAAAAVRVAAAGPAPAAVLALAGGSPRPGKLLAAVLGGALLAAGLVAGTGAGGPATSAAEGPAAPAAAAPADGRRDRFGDPLPDGALARMGTVRFRNGESDEVMAFTPDGKALVALGRIGRLWDTETGRETGSLRLENPNASFMALAVRPDGRTAVTVVFVSGPVDADHDFLREWDLTTGRTLHEVALRREQPVKPGGPRRFAFTPDARTLAMRDYDGSIRLCDTATGQVRHRLAGDREVESMTYFADGNAFAFTADGAALVAGDAAGEFHVWDVATGRELRRFGGGGAPVNVLALSPDGRWLAWVGREEKRAVPGASPGSSGRVRL
jgi:RNA polymerase sigma factor (sigma-70 family)